MTSWRQRIFAPFDNPVLRRELRLVTRRGRFPWVVLILTVGMTLVIASVGGRANAGVHPDAIGKVLFQTFFSIAHALVLVVGPGVAASSIASEHEGRTYEALALTGISPLRVATGKFLAGFAHVGGYVAALAPVGALPFLFGGVSALATLYAFAMLGMFTALATLLGLAISARLPTTRAALITSVLCGAAVAFGLQTIVGDAVGASVCEAMGMQRPGTIWLPVLLAEGTLQPLQFIALTATPVVLAALIGWFLFEVCTANLSDASADRSSGLKRWFAVSALVGSAIACAAIFAGSNRLEHAATAIGAIASFAVFGILSAFVFQGDEIIAPRRVRLQWKLGDVGLWQRFFGPGVSSSATLQLTAAALALGLISAVGMLLSLADPYGSALAPLGILAATVPAAMFLLFTVGLAMWLRVRFGATPGRLILAGTVLVLLLAPYAATAILGGEAGPNQDLLPLLASPSPAFALTVAHDVTDGRTDARQIMALLATSGTYAIVGLVFLSTAAIRADRLIATLDADAARMDAMIASEDAVAAHRGAAAVAPSTPTEVPPTRTEG